MQRRDFLRQSGAFLGGTTLAGLGAARQAAGNDRPNVLFIAIEDIAARMGCYGDPVVKTPNIDALAKRGVLFDRAYCQVPVCNPSRASISTGLRPETTGVFNNSIDWRVRMPDGHKTLPEYFRDNGYETVNLGKIHHDESLFSKPAEGAQKREDAFWNRKLRARSKGIQKPPIRPKAPRPDWLKPDDYIARSLNWGPTGLSDTEQRDGAIATAVADFIMEDHEKPFYMAVGFHAPHYALRAPDKYFEMYPPEKIELPKNPPDDLADVPHTYSKFNTTDDRWLDEDEKRQVIAAYFACISYSDTCVGILMDALKKSGHEDDTIVCLWGDHGMHLGEHYLFRKYTLFEETARVPFIMAAPGVARAGAVCRRPVELIDIYPTLADLCGLGVPDELEAISMKPLLENPSRPWKKAAFTHNTRATYKSIRTERWRYTEWGGPDKAELYDHATDPGEFTNLAGDPKYAGTLAELRTLMKGGWRAALPE